MQTYFRGLYMGKQSKDNNWSTKLKSCYFVENTFSRNESKKGAIDCMTALIIVMRALMVVQSGLMGCFSGTASYWSTEIVPIMNSVQCGECNVFRLWKLAPWHFRWNASIGVTWSDTSLVCKLWWWKGQWVRFWTPRLPNISHVRLRIPIHFPKLKQNNSRALISWHWDSKDAQEKHKMNSRSTRSRRTAKFRHANMDWYVSRLCFRHSTPLCVFLTHLNISTHIYTRRLLLLAVPSPASLECCHNLLGIDEIGPKLNSIFTLPRFE